MPMATNGHAAVHRCLLTVTCMESGLAGSGAPGATLHRDDTLAMQQHLIMAISRGVCEGAADTVQRAKALVDQAEKAIVAAADVRRRAQMTMQDSQRARRFRALSPDAVLAAAQHAQR